MCFYRRCAGVVVVLMAAFSEAAIAQDGSNELLNLSSLEAQCLMQHGPRLLTSDDDPVIFSKDFCFVELSSGSWSDFSENSEDGVHGAEGDEWLVLPDGSVIVSSVPEESDAGRSRRERVLANERMPSPPLRGFVPVDPCEAEDCVKIDRTVLACFLELVQSNTSLIDNDPFILKADQCEE